MNFVFKNKIVCLTAAVVAITAFFTLSQPAHASAPINQIFSATASTAAIGGTIRQIRVDPADGKYYVLGSSTSTLGVFTADGTSFGIITYNSAFATNSNSDFVVSTGRVYLVTTVASNGGLFRYDISGDTANLIASQTGLVGTGAITFGSGDTFYMSRGTSIINYDLSLNRLAPTSTVGSSVSRLAYGGDQIFYLSTTGRLVRVSPDFQTTVLISTAGPSSATSRALSVSADGSAVYYASTSGLSKMAVGTASGTLMWTKSFSNNLAGMDLNTSTGKIAIINTSGTVTLYDPIGPVESFVSTSTVQDVTLNWTTGIAEMDYSGVTIRRSTSDYPTSANDGTLVTSTALTTSLVDSGLEDGTYFYTIFNRTLDGYYSSGVTTTVTVDATPPPVPTLEASVTGGAAVNLTWDTPATAVSFLLRRSTEGYPGIDEGEVVTSTDNTVTSLTQSGLADGMYYYSLFAADDRGNYSSAGTASVTIDTTPPVAPTLSAEATATTIHLSWDSPATAVSYMLRRSTSGYPNSISAGTGVTSTGATSFTQSGVDENTYYYSIFAADAYGNYSSAGTATVTVDITAPLAPTGFTATASGSAVNLSWTNPVFDFALAVIRRSTTSYPTSITDGTTVTSTSATSYSDTSLADSVYYYSIFAVDAKENVSVSVTSSAMVNTYVPPTASSPASGGAAITVAPSAASMSAPLNFSIIPTAKPMATLQLNANPTTVRGYAVSLDPTFKDASILPFSTNTTTTLALPNKTGTYTVYLKYYSVTGQASEVLAQTVTYSAGANTNPKTPATPTFKRILQVGSKGEDVKALQQFLNARGFVVAPTGPGSVGNETTVFGPATAKAVTKFQEANAAQILQPIGLKKGTGVLGAATMKLLSSLL